VSGSNAYNGPAGSRGSRPPVLHRRGSTARAGVGTGCAEAFTAEIQEFLRSVGTGTTMDTNFATASEMMSVVGAALESSRTGRSVSVDSVA
jgi:predicted dehydrogenase